MKKLSKLPRHIGIILDGNGRWAKKRGLERLSGHEEGAKAIGRLLSCAKKYNIEAVSVFAFSTENWKRSKQEVDGIFEILKRLIEEKGNSFVEGGFVLRVMGDVSRLDQELQSLIKNLIERTKTNSGVVFNVGLNYGGRAEIVRAANLALEKNIEKLTEESFESLLYTSGLPPLDFVIRTSGEMRLSNFMLWQAAYSEFYFPKFYWPSFNERKFVKCLIEYSKRNRRFGKV